MFGEPAWDMLLALYVQEARQTVTRLTLVSETSKATALRWIAYLEQRDLVRCEPNPMDRRSFFIELSREGLRRIEDYLCDLD